MNRLKLEAKGYRSALIIGCVIFALGLWIQWRSIPGAVDTKALATQRLIGSTLVSVATVIGTLGTGVLFRDFWMDRVKRRSDKRFREFFGETAVTDSVRLVHAERKLTNGDGMDFASPSARQAKSLAGQIFVPEGITRWLCAEDNYAATAITALFSQRTGKFPRQVYDSFIEDDAMNFCTVGLGLGFNEFTYFACTLTRGRMFRPVFKHSVKLGPEFSVTDEFIVPFFPGGSDSLPPEWHFPAPSEDTDVALILRIPTQQGSDEGGSTQFVVAGRTAAGTAIAGAYLATKWEELYRLYRDEIPERGVDLETHALLVILEHKRSPAISASDPSKAILTSGARPYLGSFSKFVEPDPAKGPSAFDDIDAVRSFADSVRERGYGFYNPNVVRRRRSSKGPQAPASSSTGIAS